MDFVKGLQSLITEEQMAQGLRVEVVNVHPGDFRGFGGARRDFEIIVTGDTMPVKDELKKLGLWWDGDKRAWVMRSGRSETTGRSWGVDEKTVKDSVPKVQDFVASHNRAIEQENQKRLTGMGIKGTDVLSLDPKGQIKHLDSTLRANVRLRKYGVAVAYEFASDAGGALGSMSGMTKVWVTGNTFKVKDELKKFGFTFSKNVPGAVKERASKEGVKNFEAGWSMDSATFQRIEKQVFEKMIRAFEGTLGESLISAELQEAVGVKVSIPWDSEEQHESYQSLPAVKSFEAALSKGYADLGLVNPNVVKGFGKEGLGFMMTKAMGLKGVAFIRDPDDVLGQAGISPEDIAGEIKNQWQNQWLQRALSAEELQDVTGTVIYHDASNMVGKSSVKVKAVKGKTGSGYQFTMRPSPEEILRKAEESA